MAFSPPTRGWPAVAEPANWRQWVFPAHAGMARLFDIVCDAARRFPRPRGDGPPLQRRAVRGVVFSPPTRGWPAIRDWDNLTENVFPAHAGMARAAVPAHPDHGRFPRPRGDGPSLPRLVIPFETFSPPTRGWPASFMGGLEGSVVFPAHAGMAPRREKHP